MYAAQAGETAGTSRDWGSMDPVGIIGLGTVGGTLTRALADAGIPACGYDRDLGIGMAEDLSGCSVVFVCVPTPATVEGSHDLGEVWSAVEEAEPHLRPAAVVAIKSTVPPRTCDKLAEAFPKLEFASVPEFLVSARPMETLTRPDRIVIGARSSEVATILGSLMTRIAPTAPVIMLTTAEAELVKLCSNALLAAKVILANELAEMCQRFGVAWPRVQSAVGLDRRIAPDHLTVTPERGFGGSCLPKDLEGFITESQAAGYTPAVFQEIAEFNRRVRREDRGQRLSPVERPTRADAGTWQQDVIQSEGLTEVERQEIEQRLTALGYID